MREHFGEQSLTAEERSLLLQLAREALESGVQGKPLKPLQEDTLPLRLRAPGASFVTLTIRGGLRGCVGALEPYLSLAEDVREHAVAAALQDYRFTPVTSDEVGEVRIEISRITQPQPLHYSRPEDLPKKLRPGIDGVILQDGYRRATFLPQVWEKIQDPEAFLSHLCVKMGASPDLWRRKIIDIQVYQAEDFREPETLAAA